MHDTHSRYADQLSKISTVSDKIRFLDRQGLERAEIARVLGKRYQHVRNVLEQDLAKRSKEAEEDRATEGTNDGFFRVTVGSDGTITLPQEIVDQLELGESRVLTLHMKNDELRAVSPAAALAKFRALVKEMKLDGRKIVDEFIAERRQEAAREAANE